MGPHRLPHNADLSALEGKIGHKFRDRSILELALTHSSSTVQPLTDNERLEFLGDAVLALAVNEQLYRTLPEDGEGELTRIKSAAVSTITLARVSRGLGLADFMRLGKGLGGRNGLPDSVHANVTEAIFAAIYLDAGLEPAKALVIRLLEPEIATLTTSGGSENAKSQLQELAQRRFGCAPRYRVVRESGPQHDKTFEIAVEIRGRIFPEFSAHTKKEAEQGAARLAIEALTAPEKKPAPAAPVAPKPPPAPLPEEVVVAGVAEIIPGPITAEQPRAARRRTRGRRGGRGRKKPASGAPKGAQTPAAKKPAPTAAKTRSKAQVKVRGKGRSRPAKGRTQPAARAAQPAAAPPAPAAPALAPAAPAPVKPGRAPKRAARNPYDMLGNFPT